MGKPIASSWKLYPFDRCRSAGFVLGDLQLPASHKATIIADERRSSVPAFGGLQAERQLGKVAAKRAYAGCGCTGRVPAEEVPFNE